MRWERADRAERPGFTEHELKICELCGALNLATSQECVICGWHGRFDYDPEAIRAAIEEFKAASGHTDDAFFSQDVLLEEYLSSESQKPNWFIAWLRRIFHLGGDNTETPTRYTET